MNYTGWERNKPGLGVWEHRGKVAVAGLGHSSLDRRWDGQDMSKTLGAKAIDACEQAIAEAGISKDEIDGIFCCPQNGAGFGGPAATWAPRPYFPAPYDSEDGLTVVTNYWLIKNMGLNNIGFAPDNVPDIGYHTGMASQAIGDGKCHTALLVYTMPNLEGRYRRGGVNADDYAKGGRQWNAPWGNHGGNDFVNVFPVQQYCAKYGGTPNDIGHFVVNQHRNGRLTPWGFYTNTEPYMLTMDDYVNSRFILRPLRLWDCDRPVHTVTAYLFTTAERAKDMKQDPVYVLGHAQHNYNIRSTHAVLEEMEAATDLAANLILESAGLGYGDVDVLNPYDGYSYMTQFYLEGFRWHGVKRGDALRFYEEGIQVEGPHPFSSGGGNLGNGRSRSAMYTDSIQQLRGTAGKRQIQIRCETAISSFSAPLGGGWLALGKHPS